MNQHARVQPTNTNKRWHYGTKYLKDLDHDKSPFAEALTCEHLLRNLFFHFFLLIIAVMSILS